MKMMKEIPKQLKEIEKKFGIEAYNRLLDIFTKQYLKIEELTKSRDLWKNKYMNLKNKGGKNKT